MVGTIALDDVSARNWVGNAPDLTTAARILAAGGVTVTVAGDSQLVITDHVWVVVNPTPTGGSIYLPWLPRGPLPQTGALNPRRLPAAVAGWHWMQVISSSPTTRRPIRGRSPTSTPRHGSTRCAPVCASTTATARSSVCRARQPAIPNYDREYADVQVEQAISATLAYVTAHPNLTVGEFLGGSYIVTASITTLPEQLPYPTLTDPAASTFASCLPPCATP